MDCEQNFIVQVNLVTKCLIIQLHFPKWPIISNILKLPWNLGRENTTSSEWQQTFFRVPIQDGFESESPPKPC